MAKKKNPIIETTVDADERAKAVVLNNDQEYFEIIGDKNRRFILQDGRLIDLRFGVPKGALELYMSGQFKYIGLREGSEVLFKNEPQEVIDRLISKAPREKDILILKKVKG